MADAPGCAICGAPVAEDVLRAIDAAGGNVRRAAATLGLPYTTLLGRLDVYRLSTGETLREYRARVHPDAAARGVPKSAAYAARGDALSSVPWTSRRQFDGRRVWQEHRLRLRVAGRQRSARLYLPSGKSVEQAHRDAIRALMELSETWDPSTGSISHD
jgi:hypothetical protein